MARKARATPYHHAILEVAMDLAAVAVYPQGEPFLLLWFRVQSLRLYPRSRTSTLQLSNHTVVQVYALFGFSSSRVSLGS